MFSLRFSVPSGVLVTFIWSPGQLAHFLPSLQIVYLNALRAVLGSWCAGERAGGSSSIRKDGTLALVPTLIQSSLSCVARAGTNLSRGVQVQIQESASVFVFYRVTRVLFKNPCSLGSLQVTEIWKGLHGLGSSGNFVKMQSGNLDMDRNQQLRSL